MSPTPKPVPLPAEMDARVARTRAAVLRTATDLLVEGGPAAVTIDAIVAHSGVAKSTIYRHWESRDEILIAVIENCAPALEAPDPAFGFEHGLRSLVDQIFTTLSDPEWARIVPVMLHLKSHQAGIADVEQRMEHRQDETFEGVLALGVAEGVIAADDDHEEIGAQLIGPLLFAALTGKPPLTQRFAERVVDNFLRARTVTQA
jgi:AcrR family transcriptional regulator